MLILMHDRVTLTIVVLMLMFVLMLMLMSQCEPALREKVRKYRNEKKNIYISRSIFQYIFQLLLSLTRYLVKMTLNFYLPKEAKLSYRECWFMLRARTMYY